MMKVRVHPRRPIHDVLVWDFEGVGVLRFGKIEVMRCMRVTDGHRCRRRLMSSVSSCLFV